jgi:fermentation-respiration switch protein FrsA (DUF1100 family)
MKRINLIILFVAVITKLTYAQENKKTFPPSDKVTVEKVFFKNRFDITVVGDMYLPNNLNKSEKHAAIIVGHPYGGVKEQTAGLYAQKMAERGFVTLAFDASYNGESKGTPRRTASPEVFVEDFSAAVDFIGTRPFVDRNNIGVIGVCGSAGFTISAAAIDPRMKAIATVSMYDMGRANRSGLHDEMPYAERVKILKEVGQQRWKEFEGADTRYAVGVVDKVDANTPAVAREFYEYYRMPRGQHPNATNAFTFTSTAAMMNFFPFTQIETISPRPLLFVVGETAHSRYFSEEAYKLAAEPKELYVVPGAGHVDLYDRLEYIPFDKLNSFFTKYLK